MRPHNAFQKVWANGLTAQRNNLAIAVMYNLPQLNPHRNAGARSLLNGWGVAAIFQYYSGNPQFVYQSAEGQDNSNNFEYPDLVPGQPDGVPHRSINDWFNTARFTEAIGHYGNAPRNPSWVLSPSNNPLEFELKRTFAMPFAEQQKLSLQILAFNVFNPSWRSQY